MVHLLVCTCGGFVHATGSLGSFRKSQTLELLALLILWCIKSMYVELDMRVPANG